MHRGISTFCLLALTSALPACIAFPFATPPIAISGGGGVRYGTPSTEQTGPGMGHIDVGVKPLQLMRAWEKRRADVGLGYTFEAGAGPSRHGAFFEGTVFPVVDQVGRIGVAAQPRLWYESETDKMRFGMAVRVTAEARWFTSTTFSGTSSSGGAMGYAHGEGGLGLYLEGAYAKIGERPDVTLGFGLTCRIPATVGLALVFLR
ncbi:hypothetical protein [Polyangium sp. y55x31]|uniref:hypothetical protein n=1 Tax=Polyangium sp. y55x31 TaxID=3042688 RepID=UPI0024826888|nr:hypothetical protein [Polyangium sp. y55x31]MDI1477130.1 hypothetical protein [Polyangium sp. y55x31]